MLEALVYELTGHDMILATLPVPGLGEVPLIPVTNIKTPVILCNYEDTMKFQIAFQRKEPSGVPCVRLRADMLKGD